VPPAHRPREQLTTGTDICISRRGPGRIHHPSAACYDFGRGEIWRTCAVAEPALVERPGAGLAAPVVGAGRPRVGQAIGGVRGR
jgi:hypothetical protein